MRKTRMILVKTQTTTLMLPGRLTSTGQITAARKAPITTRMLPAILALPSVQAVVAVQQPLAQPVQIQQPRTKTKRRSSPSVHCANLKSSRRRRMTSLRSLTSTAKRSEIPHPRNNQCRMNLRRDSGWTLLSKPRWSSPRSTGLKQAAAAGRAPALRP